MADDARRRILERRARFVVAALATAGVAATEVSGCKTEADEKPYRIRSDDEKKPPRACLNVATPEEDASVPRPCLSEAWEPPHDAIAHPCLSPKPRDAGATPCPAPPPTDGGAKHPFGKSGE